MSSLAPPDEILKNVRYFSVLARYFEMFSRYLMFWTIPDSMVRSVLQDSAPKIVYCAREAIYVIFRHRFRLQTPFLFIAGRPGP